MITNDIGIDKQNFDENPESWGDILNKNDDRYEAMIKPMIMASTVNRNILHVFPTDSVGNPKLETYIKQMAEIEGASNIISPSFQAIINNIVGNNDVSYPLTGDNIVYWGVLKSALEYITAFNSSEQWVVILHPGQHVAKDDLIVPANCVIMGMSKATTELNLSNVNLKVAKDNISLRGLSITGTGAYALYDVVDAAISNCEMVDCKIDIPIYFDSYNKLSPIDLFIKGCELNNAVVFVNSYSGASNIQLGTVAIMGSFMGKEAIYLSDEVDGVKTVVELNTQNNKTLTEVVSEEQALVSDISAALTAAADYATFKTELSALNKDNYYIKGIHNAVALAAPYPILRFNTYV